MSTPNINTGAEMKTQDAITYFGGIKPLAEALSIWPHNISRWGDTVPIARQYEIEVKTNGGLKADEPSQLK
jgi:transcriptional repressor of cell division inhibition gene dicB